MTFTTTSTRLVGQPEAEAGLERGDGNPEEGDSLSVLHVFYCIGLFLRHWEGFWLLCSGQEGLHIPRTTLQRGLHW